MYVHASVIVLAFSSAITPRIRAIGRKVAGCCRTNYVIPGATAQGLTTVGSKVATHAPVCAINLNSHSTFCLGGTSTELGHVWVTSWHCFILDNFIDFPITPVMIVNDLADLLCT